MEQNVKLIAWYNITYIYVWFIKLILKNVKLIFI